jgi:phosphatidate cytidylyltransferase
LGPDELSEPGHAPEQGGPPGAEPPPRQPPPTEPAPLGAPPLEPPPLEAPPLEAPPPDAPAPGPPPAEPPAPELPPTEILKPSRAGRNLRAAIVVGLLLGGLALVTLFTVKVIFLIYVAAVIALGLWELTRAVEVRGVRLPLVPVGAGGAVMLGLAYYSGERPLVAALAVTAIAVLAWRMAGGSAGYLRDVTAGIFSLVYLPLMASFAALMLAAPDGSRRVLAWIVVTICSDIGGYLVGSLLGRHPMAAVISPHKTWEGFAGSALACVVAGVLLLLLLLHGTWWQGAVLGLAAVGAATLGDLSESMIKRDLQIKDMGTLLPGHGGVLDRIDSLLITAPVVWLLLVVFFSR